jgi:Domain of unknown function (DUF4189)
MLRNMLMVAGLAIAGAVTLGAPPAVAGYGAVAYDAATGRYGFAWNEKTAHEAEEIAVRDCKSKGCKVVIPVGPRECAALASSENGKVWGGKKAPSRDSAKLGALENCQKRTAGKCEIRGSECNK